jgi:hypothetical protein
MPEDRRLEPTTTCESGGLDFRPSAEKTKKDGCVFCVELAAGRKAPAFYGKNKSLRSVLILIVNFIP